jgi:hypothetical protein
MIPTKTEQFFARMAGKKPFTMVPWAPLIGHPDLVGNPDSHGRYDSILSASLVEAMHRASGLEPMYVRGGMAASLNLACQSKRVLGYKEYHNVPFAPAFYATNLAPNYGKFMRTHDGVREGGNVFFRGAPLKGDAQGVETEVIPLKLGPARHGMNERMIAWAQAWMKIFLATEGNKSHPALWMWADNGQLFGMIVPEAFYQKDHARFRADAMLLLDKVLPEAEALAPVAVQKAVLGNIHLHSAMTASRKRAA